MKTMNMPGFTAEASLNYCDKKYPIRRSRRPERNSSAIEPQVRAGGGGKSTTCNDAYGDCYIGCSVDYPESKDSPNNFNAEFRDGCLDSCDAAHRLCAPARTAFSNSVPIFALGAGRFAR